jgi:hypothetical protein
MCPDISVATRLLLALSLMFGSVQSIAPAQASLYEWRNEALEKLPLLFTMDTPAQTQGERDLC